MRADGNTTRGAVVETLLRTGLPRSGLWTGWDSKPLGCVILCGCLGILPSWFRNSPLEHGHAEVGHAGARLLAFAVAHEAVKRGLDVGRDLDSVGFTRCRWVLAQMRDALRGSEDRARVEGASRDPHTGDRFLFRVFGPRKAEPEAVRSGMEVGQELPSFDVVPDGFPGLG